MARTGTSFAFIVCLGEDMASQHTDSGVEYEPSEDFNSEAFVTRREPIRELINTFSELYIDSEEENAAVEDADDGDPFPPPPPEMEERPELESDASSAEQVRQLIE